MLQGIRPGTVLSRNGGGRLKDGAPVRRILFFGKNMSRTRCTGGLIDALVRHGLSVKWLNVATLRRRMGRERAMEFAQREFDAHEPDLVFVFCRDLPAELLAKFREQARVVVWVEDLLPEPDEALREYMAMVDLVCMTALRHHDTLQEAGAENIMFLLSGFSPKYHYPAKRQKKVRDVAFIGGPGVCGQRAEFLAEISKRCRTEVFGVKRPWERWENRFPSLRVRGPLRNAAYRRVCATSRIVIGLNEVNDVPLYFSNRTFLTLGCGAFHLTHYVPGLETQFEDGEHLAWYRDPEECLERIDYYLHAEETRARIARQGYELAMHNHQYYHRIDSILKIVTGVAPVVLQPAPRLDNVRVGDASLSLASGGG